MPGRNGVDFDGLELSRSEQQELLRVDSDEWVPEIAEIRRFFDRFGDRMPEALVRTLDDLSETLTATTV